MLGVKPLLAALQLVPLSVERKTLSQVPAKRFVPETAREKMDLFGKPLLAARQLVPLSVERKTLPPSLPANRFEPETAKAVIFPPKGPFVCTHCASAEKDVKRVTIRKAKPRLR